MTTPIAQNLAEQAAREKLPPPEQRDTAASTLSAPMMAVTPDVLQVSAPLPTSAPRRSTWLGRYLYSHRESPDKPAGFLGYQIVRNVAAAVPYGLATAAVWQGFEWFTKKTAASQNYFVKGFNGLAKSPIRDIAMIGAGFTLYRGTLKYVRYMREYLFNKDYTPEQAQDAADNAGRKSAELFQEIAPAEASSTTYGAIALGLGRRYVEGIASLRDRKPEDKIAAAALGDHTKAQQPMFRVFREGKFNPGFTGEEKLFWRKLWGKGSGVWREAGVFILSFLAFFELSDRLYKDVQIRRGRWNGEHNALARVSPEKHTENVAREVASGKDGDLEYQLHKRGEAAHPEMLGTPDPNIFRLTFTRVLPTMLGIGAYTFTKRAAYLTMGHFTARPTFLGRATVEGAATATFFVMTGMHDIFEKLWGKYFEPKKEPIPLTPEQARNYETLLAKLNERERGHAGRVA